MELDESLLEKTVQRLSEKKRGGVYFDGGHFYDLEYRLGSGYIFSIKGVGAE